MADKTIVYVDTCAIIDAVKLGCWDDLCQQYSVHTVEAVQRESQDGDRTDPEYVPVNPKCFGTTVTVHPVAAGMITRVAARLGDLAPDRGELELLAYVMTQDPGALLICSSDRAAVRAGCALGLSSRFRSLELLVTRGRATKYVFSEEKTTEKWLTEVKTKFTAQQPGWSAPISKPHSR